MPDRPKRRKNKNKRKNNKNCSTDVNKNNIEESKTVESCSDVTKNQNDEQTSHVKDENIEIEVSPEISNFNETEKSIKTESIKGESRTISETPQLCGEASYTSPDIESPLSEQCEELNKTTLLSSDVCSDLNLKHKNDAECEEEEKEDDKEKNRSGSLELFSPSKEMPGQDNNLNEQKEDVLQTYIVETPDQVPTKTKCKLDNAVKSKSCDNDDCPTIVEIIDDSHVHSDHKSSFTVEDQSNVIISGEETDIEWEKVNHFNLPQTPLIKGILSSDTIPLNIVHCEQIKSLSPQEELSLRNYLQSLNLSTSPSYAGDIKTEIEEIINREIKYRLRKKGIPDDTTFIRAGPCRSLAVIDEEGSGDSSKTSRRHSYLSDKKSDSEELEDDVFECKKSRQLKNANINFMENSFNKRLIPQPCIRVDAKLKEPEISEARGDWSMKTVEKLTGAELVYLTDSSSSTSSIYDLNDDADKAEETDASVRMITPTIEVTDTESLLSNTFLSNNNDKHIISESCENSCETILKSELPTDEKESKELNDELLESNLRHDTHEIVILNTDNIKTDLFVKDIIDSRPVAESEELCKSQNSVLKNNSAKPPISSSTSSTGTDVYDLEIKVLKCELNNAINNLIKEVISDSENNKECSRDTFTRQDSSSSLDSSQCTAKYNPTHSSLNDISNIMHDDTYVSTNKELQMDIASSHVQDVLQCVTEKQHVIDTKLEGEHCRQPFKLRDICIKKISSFPFGDKILEELAHVSLRLQNMSALVSERKEAMKISTKSKSSKTETDQYEIRNSTEHKSNENYNAPPPILPRKSSLKKAQDEPIKLVTSKSEPKYECLSPSQKMLMEKTNTSLEKDLRSQTSVNTHSNTWHNNERKNNLPNITTSIAPMKSETGSRLLALLRDTTISNNLSTPILEDKNSSLSIKPQTKTHSESFSKRCLEDIDLTHVHKEGTSNKKSFSNIIPPSTVKPLLPPKPKKLSTYFYESDGGSDFRGNSFRTMHSNKKYFHYSTGNLNKEIEDDISSIQNMHRHCINLRDQSYESSPRRPSLPKDLCDQQMEYIRQKEKEVDAELRRLEQEQNKRIRNRGPRAPMLADDNRIFDSQSKKYINKDFTSTSEMHKNMGNSKLSSLFSSSQEELLREKMYSEYVNQMAEREQRKQQKVIKVTQTPIHNSAISKSMPLIHRFDSMNNHIEQEFISKARDRWYKLGIRDPETEDETDAGNDLYVEPKVIEHKIKVIEAGEEKDVKKLPSHMQEFVKFTVKDKEDESGSTGESNAEKASAHVVVFCAVIILVLTVGKFLLQLLRNK